LGELTPLSSPLDKSDATFIVRFALSGTPNAVSFESFTFPGQFLRHQDLRIKLQHNDGSDLFRQDASFIPLRRGVFAQTRFESVNFPGFFIRHSNFQLFLAKDDGSPQFQQDSTWRRLPQLSTSAPPGALSFQSVNFPDRLMRHHNFLGELTQVISPSDKADSEFIVRQALNGSPISVSLEAVNFPGFFLRHQDFRIKLQHNDGSDTFRQDASFNYNDGGCVEGNCQVSFESVNFPGRFIRHFNFELWLAGSATPLEDFVWQPVPTR
jgi:hypothetical protein